MSDLMKVSSNPHIRSKDSTSRIMLAVIIALLPTTIFGIYNFGIRALLIVAITIASTVLTEFVFEKITKRKNTIGDLSAVVTGLLLALNLLPALPLDGGRLLALALSLRYDLATQMKVMRVLGMILGLGLAGVAVASAVWWGAANFSLAAAGCFLIYASQVGATTEAMAALRQFLDRRNRG